MNKLLIMFVALVMSGCTVIPNKAGIGSPIDEVINKYGTNYKMTEKGNGRRSYDWHDNYEEEKPNLVYEKTKTEKTKSGWDVTTKETINLNVGAHTVKRGCRYRYNTKYNQKRKNWIVTTISRSGNGC